MKKIIVTQRVDVINSVHERRDGIDQKLIKFLIKCECIPIVINNNINLLTKIIDIVNPNGILLSGGNDLSLYGGDAPERDQLETFLLDWAIKNRKPICGICRGMQMICNYFGANLDKIQNHVAVNHDITGRINRKVNSYHSYGIKHVIPGFEILANTDDNIECIYSKSKNILGIMWHPEREEVFKNEDIILISSFFKGKLNY